MKVLPNHCFVSSILISFLLAACTERADQANKIVTSPAAEDKQQITAETTELNLRGVLQISRWPARPGAHERALESQ